MYNACLQGVSHTPGKTAMLMIISKRKRNLDLRCPRGLSALWTWQATFLKSWSAPAWFLPPRLLGTCAHVSSVSEREWSTIDANAEVQRAVVRVWKPQLYLPLNTCQEYLQLCDVDRYVDALRPSHSHQLFPQQICCGSLKTILVWGFWFTTQKNERRRWVWPPMPRIDQYSARISGTQLMTAFWDLRCLTKPF